MASALPVNAIVVVKSTVPVGTGDEIEVIIAAARAESHIPVVSNPEFLRAGSAVRDFRKPDRIVIGADSTRARDVMRQIYELLRPRAPLLFTTRRSAELIKYGANALLATKVAFINELAELCERTSADVQEVAHAIGLDLRIGPRFLQPGPGFGGSCFRKDAMALVKMGEDYDAHMRITEAVVTSNDCRKRLLLRKIASALGGTVRNRTIAIWGVTFKPDTDDLRDSPAVPLVAALLDAGAKVRLYDPKGLQAARALWQDRIHAAPDACSAARGADVVVVMTEGEEFRRVNLDRVRRLMAAPTMVDMRNLFAPDDVVKLGFAYHSVGRRSRAGEWPLGPRANGHDQLEVTEPRRKRKEPMASVAVT